MPHLSRELKGLDTVTAYTITGHRPKDLTLDQIRNMGPLAVEMVDRAANRNASWHVGGALGVDQLVHQVLINMEQDVMLHSPGGVEKQGYNWTPEQRSTLMLLMTKTQSVCATCLKRPMVPSSYARDLNARNECMVNASSGTIAFWNGKTFGGTYNCIRYTLSSGKPVWNALDGFNRITESDIYLPIGRRVGADMDLDSTDLPI
jgi:uncharacterized phage-like protein YoqJ